MIRKNIYFIPLIIFSFNSCSDNKENRASLLGEWQSLNRQHDMGTTLTFREDSTVGMASDVILNYKYRLQGDYLISISQNSHVHAIVQDTSVVEFKDKTMILRRKTDKGESTTILTRETKEFGSNKIVGKWTWIHQTGRVAESEFFDDGRAQAYILIKADEGKFTTNEDTLSMTFHKTSMRNIIYRVNSDTLFLESLDGKNEYSYIKTK